MAENNRTIAKKDEKSMFIASLEIIIEEAMEN